METILIQELFKLSTKNKIYLIEGIYKKTQKNSQCKNFYKTMKFKLIKKNNYRINLKNTNIKQKKIMNVIYERN